MIKFRHLLLATSTIAFCAPSLVHAQETEGASEQRKLEAVVVTAQKREESMQDVPISINAVSADSLVNAGAGTIEDLASVVPGINLTRQSAATLIYIRGIGTPGGQAGLDAAVSTFQDGVLLPSMSGSTLMFNNIARIEVLKGPQGTLYGRNATGGAINIVTKDPNPEGEGKFEIGYGNYDTISANAYVAGAVGSNAEADFAFAMRDQNDGFGKNITTGHDANDRSDIGARTKLVIHGNDKLDLTVAADYYKGEGSYAMSFRPINNTPTFDGQTGWNGDFYDVKTDVDAEIKTEAWGLSGKAVIDLDWATLTSITAYRSLENFQHGDLDMTAIPLAEFPLSESNKQFTQELQLAGDFKNGGTWIGGLYFLDGESGYDPFRIQGLLIPAQVQPLVDANLLPAAVQALLVATQHKATMDTQAYAIFGQTTFPVMANTDLTLGARYTRDERSLNAYGGLVDAAGNVIIPIYADAFGGEYKTNKSWEEPTWRIALDHKFTSDILGYVSYSRGFKSGVYNLTAPTDPVVNPETLDAFEVGTKSELFNNTLRLNAAAFYYTYDDIQVTIIQGAAQTLLNAAKAEVKGIDIDFVAALTDNLTLSGGGSWVDATYEKFDGAPISTPDPTFSTGVAVITVPGSASGNRLVRTPEYTFNLSMDYSRSLPMGELGVNLTYAWQDEYAFEPDQALIQDAYGLLNASIGMSNIGGSGWNAKVWGRNIADEEYLSQGTTNFLGYLGAAGEPATYGVSLGFEY